MLATELRNLLDMNVLEGIKAPWKEDGMYFDNMSYVLYYNDIKYDLFKSVFSNIEMWCISSCEEGIKLPTLRGCLEWFDENVYKEKEMEDKKITWEFQERWTIKGDYWWGVLVHGDYGIFKMDEYELRDIENNILFNSQHIIEVIKYAENLIKDPKHKEREELLKTIQELKDKTKELEEKVESI